MRILIAAFMLVASTARADDGPSPTTAFELSGGITLGGAALIVPGILVAPNHPIVAISTIFVGGAAVLIGPSIGHWYAGERSATVGEVAILLGGTAMVGSLLVGWGECGLDKDDPHGCTPTAAYALVLTGAAAIGTGIVWDIATAGSAARRFRAKHELGLAPWRGDRSAGLVLGGRF